MGLLRIPHFAVRSQWQSESAIQEQVVVFILGYSRHAEVYALFDLPWRPRYQGLRPRQLSALIRSLG